MSSGGAPSPAPQEEAKPEITALVEKTIAEKPVVMYALEWCEFCWSVRNMFDAAGVAYETVDLDSVAYQGNNLGGDIRVVLRNMTGAPTIPQIFVGGEHIGGATETFDAFNDGSLKLKLKGADVDFDGTMNRDAYSFLPTWLHPR
ncbi:MAG: glutaredoxin [Rhodobacter sp.]|nr:glutaredoxin [Rhodobacter sp.]